VQIRREAAVVVGDGHMQTVASIGIEAGPVKCDRRRSRASVASDVGEALLHDPVQCQPGSFIGDPGITSHVERPVQRRMTIAPIIDQLPKRLLKPHLVEDQRPQPVEHAIVDTLDAIGQLGNGGSAVPDLGKINAIGGACGLDAGDSRTDAKQRRPELVVQPMCDLLPLGLLQGNQAVDEHVIVRGDAGERAREAFELHADAAEF
jgi:hypothetical protein